MKKKAQDSHAKRFEFYIRDEKGHFLKDEYKGKESYQIYYPLTYTTKENELFEIFRLFVNNFYTLNSKDKESFKQFVENEKINTDGLV